MERTTSCSAEPLDAGGASNPPDGVRRDAEGRSGGRARRAVSHPLRTVTAMERTTSCSAEPLDADAPSGGACHDAEARSGGPARRAVSHPLRTVTAMENVSASGTRPGREPATVVAAASVGESGSGEDCGGSGPGGSRPAAGGGPGPGGSGSGESCGSLAEVAFVGSPDALGRVLGLVDALVAELGALSLDGAGRGVLRALVAALGRVRAGADAAEARAVTALEGFGDGDMDAVEVLRRNTGSSHREARRRRRRAGTLAKMPKVSEALAKGDISPEHADALARAAEATSAGAVDDDAALLAEVAAVPADRAGREIQDWTQRNQDPVDLHEQHLRQRRRRRLHFGEGDDGMLTAHAAFDRVLGAQFRSLIGGIADRLWRAEGGRDNPNSRSVEQRRLDALAIAVGLQPAPPADPPQHNEPPPDADIPAGVDWDAGTPTGGAIPADETATEHERPTRHGRGRAENRRSHRHRTTASAGGAARTGTGAQSHDRTYNGSETPNIGEPPDDGGTESSSRTDGGSGVQRGGGTHGSSGREGRRGTDGGNGVQRGGATQGRSRTDGGNGVQRGGATRNGSGAPDGGGTEGRRRTDGSNGVQGGGRTRGSGTPSGGGTDDRSRTDVGDGVQGGGGTRSGAGAHRGRGANGRARAKDRAEARTVPPRHQIVVVASADLISGKDPHGRCEIPGIGPIPQTELERLACDAELFGLLFSGDGEPLWHGRGERTATDAQRRALVARDGGCVLCAAEPAWCESHHVRAWAAPGDGPTDIDNLALLCTKCHHRLHDHKRVLIRHAQRGWTTVPDPRYENGHRRRDKPDPRHDKPDPRPGKSDSPPGDPDPRARGPDPPPGDPDPCGNASPQATGDVGPRALGSASEPLAPPSPQLPNPAGMRVGTRLG